MNKTAQAIAARYRPAGFALPTVLIVSTVMLASLVFAVSAVGVSQTAISDQYYTRLAREAALSGVERATACIEGNSNVAEWSSLGRTLRPNTKCDGSVHSTASRYVVETQELRTTFEVGPAVSDGGHISVDVKSATQLLKKSDGSVWREYDDGQLGDGTTINRNKPVESVFLRNPLPNITY